MSDAVTENEESVFGWKGNGNVSENYPSKIMHTNALNSFIKSLENASGEEKDAGGGKEGSLQIIVSPIKHKAEFGSLDVINVYRGTSVRNPDSYTDIYEIPSLHLRVGRSQAETSIYTRFLNQVASSLDPNEIEVDTSRVRFVPKSHSYWDNNWKEIGDDGEIYSQEIYPRVLNAVLANVRTVGSSGNIQIVDLFGGDGEFLQLLYSHMPEATRNSSEFHLVDSSSASLVKARAVFVSSKYPNISIHEPHPISPNEEVFQGITTPPQIVTAIGGLCGSIVSREEAYGITERIYQEMAKGGMLFVSGLTGSLLNSEDFQKIGFKVKQMSVPENVVYLKKPFQLYVLQK